MNICVALHAVFAAKHVSSITHYIRQKHFSQLYVIYYYIIGSLQEQVHYYRTKCDKSMCCDPVMAWSCPPLYYIGCFVYTNNTTRFNHTYNYEQAIAGIVGIAGIILIRG